MSQFQQQAIRVVPKNQVQMASHPAMSFPMTFPTGVPITLQQQFPTQAQNLQEIQQTLNQSSPQPPQKGSHCIYVVVIVFKKGTSLFHTPEFEKELPFAATDGVCVELRRTFFQIKTKDLSRKKISNLI